MPQTYIRAIEPGAVGRSSPVAVSQIRSGMPVPGNRGTSGPGQDCISASVTAAGATAGASARARPAMAGRPPTHDHGVGEDGRGVLFTHAVAPFGVVWSPKHDHDVGEGGRGGPVEGAAQR